MGLDLANVSLRILKLATTIPDSLTRSSIKRLLLEYNLTRIRPSYLIKNGYGDVQLQYVQQYGVLSVAYHRTDRNGLPYLNAFIHGLTSECSKNWSRNSLRVSSSNSNCLLAFWDFWLYVDALRRER